MKYEREMYVSVPKENYVNWWQIINVYEPVTFSHVIYQNLYVPPYPSRKRQTSAYFYLEHPVLLLIIPTTDGESHSIYDIIFCEVYIGWKYNRNSI